MPVAVATRPKRAASKRVARGRGFRSAAEMREVLDRVLSEANRHERLGPLLQATQLRVAIVCPDIKGVVQVSASDEPGSCIRWRFDRRGAPKPDLVLTMDSGVANEWLQGGESVPMAIAHRRMKCSGDARFALLYLPAMKLLAKPYRRVVRAEYPHLAIQP